MFVAGGIKQEDQTRAEIAMKRLCDVFGTTPQSCMTAYMALLKCVSFNLQEAYNKMLEGEFTKLIILMNNKCFQLIYEKTSKGYRPVSMKQILASSKS